MSEENEKPGFASLGIALIILILEFVLYRFFGYIPGWRISALIFIFLAFGLVLGVMSLWEDNIQKSAGICGLIFTVSAFAFQIVILTGLFRFSNQSGIF